MRWLDLKIGGQKWGVYLVNKGHKRLQDEDEHVFGVTYPEECRIYLARGQSEQALEDTLLHELLHASFEVSGAAYDVGDSVKEERIVRGLTPVLHRLLKDLGLRFPKAST